MATLDQGRQTEKRKRRIAAFTVAGMSLTLVAVSLAYWWNAGHNQPPRAVSRNVPTNVHQQLSGYSFTRSEEGRRIFTVHAARSVAFAQGGTTVLEDVRVDFFGREGTRHDLLRTRRCDYKPDTGALFAPENVALKLNAGDPLLPSNAQHRPRPVDIQTSSVSFTQQGSKAVTDAPVQFRINTLTGTAHGMTYATKEDWLELERDIAMEFIPRGKTQPAGRSASARRPEALADRSAGVGAPSEPMRLKASRLRYETLHPPNRQITLWGPVEFTQGHRQVLAEHGIVSLDSQNRMTGALFEGGVRLKDLSPGKELEGHAPVLRAQFDPLGSRLRRLRGEGGVEWSTQRSGRTTHAVSDQLEVIFAGDHPRAQGGQALGNADLTMEFAADKNQESPRPASGGQSWVGRQTLTAGELAFTFHADGQSLKEARTRGASKLVLYSSDPKVGDRIVTADPFLMAFDAKGRLTGLRGFSRPHVVFEVPRHAPPGSLPQETSSDELDAKFDPESGGLDAADQIGDFQYREGDRQGSADRARYDSSSQLLELKGQPRVWDPELNAQADRIVIDLERDLAKGSGHVRSTHLQSANSSPKSPPADPTHVVADRMVAERAKQYVHYEGHVRTWRGQDVMESSSLDVHRSERRVTSGVGVVTSHVQPPPAGTEGGGSPPAGREPRPVTIRADRLEYLDQGRKGVYRGNVELHTDDTVMKSDRLDAYFAAQGDLDVSEIDRAVAEGHVIVTQQTRRSTGDHAEYSAAAGTIVVTGGPPTLYDADKDFTTGRRLTFYVHDDTVRVEGDEKSPALSKHRMAH